MGLNNLIGYTCSYIPVELISATGYRPYRLLHGNTELTIEGEKALKVDACPLIKSNLGYILANREKFKALIISTGCDMARRLSDVLLEVTDIPIFVFNNPRTDNYKMYSDEINQLVAELEILGKRKLDRLLLKNEIEKWENLRQELTKIDQNRFTIPSKLSTTTFHKIMMKYHQGDIENIDYEFVEEVSIKPKVFFVGSPVSYETNSLLELIEERFRIVGDFNCGISRPLYIEIKEKTLEGIKKAYFNQPACIFKRPNDSFYENVLNCIKKVRATGVIAWIVEYCDNYDFEITTMEQYFQMPLLKLKSGLSIEHLHQLTTRLDAFVEMLMAGRQSIL